MSKFCTSCGKPLNEGSKFCTECGTEEKTEVTTYTNKIFSNAAPAYKEVGELTLPLELAPGMGDLVDVKLFSVLKSGFGELISGFKITLANKRLLVLVAVLTFVWLLVNLLAALGFFPLPVRLLSWLTAARGSLIGGSIGKGLVAALMAQIITDKQMFKGVKGGMSQLLALLKRGSKAYSPLLMGAGASLIACNMMLASNLQNTMVCLAGFALSAKALTRNGFLRGFISSLLPNTSQTGISSVMGGWTVGFALFILVSLIPGRYNGYIVGATLLIAGIVLMILNNKKKEAAL